MVSGCTGVLKKTENLSSKERWAPEKSRSGGTGLRRGGSSCILIVGEKEISCVKGIHGRSALGGG